MSVVPFDPERPFPISGARGPRPDDSQARIEMLERSVALLLRDVALNRERAERAEARVEALTTELFRSDLGADEAAPLTRTG